MFSSLASLQNITEIKLVQPGSQELPGSLNAPSQRSESSQFKAEESVSAIPSEEETELTSFTEKIPDPEETD